MKGGLIHGWIWWLWLVWLWLVWLWLWRRVRFDYSIVYLVNYGWDKLIVLYLEFLDFPSKM